MHDFAWMHATTVPAEYYEAHYSITGGCNMDRGGYGQTKDGVNFACVFDGVSAGGKINAYAAQSFAETTLTCLDDYLTSSSEFEASHVARCKRGALLVVIGMTVSYGVPNMLSPTDGWLVYTIDTGVRVVVTALLVVGAQKLSLWFARRKGIPSREIFERAIAQTNNPGRSNKEHEAIGGSATGVFAFIRPEHWSTDTYEVKGAAIGDANAIYVQRHVDPHDANNVASVSKTTQAAMQKISDRKGQLFRASVLNEVWRRGNNATDTGGQLNMGGEINGEISDFCQSLGKLPEAQEGLLILASDGLLDNVVGAEKSLIIPYIVQTPFFGRYGTHVKDGKNDEKSTHRDLQYHKYADGWNQPSLPTLDELVNHGSADLESMQELPSVTCEQAALRLVGYLRWVTALTRQKEKEYYSLQKQQSDLVSEPPRPAHFQVHYSVNM
jgi:hypothetical protein